MWANRRMRWALALMVVVLAHLVVAIALLREKAAGQLVPQFTEGVAVQAQLSAPLISGDVNASTGSNNLAQKSDTLPSKSVVKPAANEGVDNQAPVKNMPANAVSSNASGTTKSVDVSRTSPALGGAERSVSSGSAVVSSAAHGGNSTEPIGVGRGVVDCNATIKPANAGAAGLDVAVWVEREASGARFVGLLNQSGEGSRYLREVRAAVANVRFATQDVSCVGKKVKVTVRVTS